MLLADSPYAQFYANIANILDVCNYFLTKLVVDMILLWEVLHKCYC